MSSSTADLIVNLVGTVGGLLVALSIPPQIYRVYKRQSALDISATRQAITTAGVFLYIVYLWHYQEWAVVVPLCVELSFLITLSGLKYHLDSKAKESGVVGNRHV